MQEEFIKKLSTGSEEAFKKLYQDYSAAVMSVCLGFLRNSEDARDTVQEVFTEVFRSIKNFRGQSALSTWIYRIAAAKSIDFIRKQKRSKRFGLVKKILGADEADELGLLTTKQNPENDAESGERALILKSALDKLPESQRIALTLSKIEGFTNTEIAEIMKTSVSAVESLIHRGKNGLRNRLDKYFRRHLGQAKEI